MPNHVSNKLSFLSPIGDYRAEAGALEQLQKLMGTADHPFDFNVLFPYPERFEVLDKAANAANVPWGKRPKDGYNSGGYEWCRENWGTKWNAYDVAFDDTSVTFNTAWATPWPIWEALAQRFKGIRMVVEYADENRDRNCGIAEYQDGKRLYHARGDDLADHELFARAIIYEQRAGEYYRDLQEAEKRIKELEAEIARDATTAQSGE